MCRLFGFRSVFASKVHSSLIEAENAIMQQSERHPDGWGLAYYLKSTPHLIKSTATAVEDDIFKRVSGVAASNTVVAHIRKATVGSNSILNTHPFQFGHWVFAHNGNIKNFDTYRQSLLNLVRPDLDRYRMGDTDSEILFFILLSYISGQRDLLKKNYTLRHIMEHCKKAIANICKIVGPYETDDSADPSSTFLTFVLTDGHSFLAHQGGKTLHYSTYKQQCPERETCGYYNRTCETPTPSGPVNHLLISSEPIKGANIWQKMNPGEVVAIDQDMGFLKTRF